MFNADRQFANTRQSTDVKQQPASSKKTTSLPSNMAVEKQLSRFYSAAVSLKDPETETLEDIVSLSPRDNFVTTTLKGNRYLHNGVVKAVFTKPPTAPNNTVLTPEHEEAVQRFVSRKSYL